MLSAFFYFLTNPQAKRQADGQGADGQGAYERGANGREGLRARQSFLLCQLVGGSINQNNKQRAVTNRGFDEHRNA